MSDLNERAAKVQGWYLCEYWSGIEEPPPTIWHPPGHEGCDAPLDSIPDYEHSIDAQRPLEAMAREKGWRLTDVYEYRDRTFQVVWRSHTGTFRVASVPTESEARLRVLLEILEPSDD